MLRFESLSVIGVVVPAHDEEAGIVACLDSLSAASRCRRLKGEPVVIVVALDACRDRTGALASAHGAFTVSLEARNVGAARALGAAFALEAGARWLAFTDADSVVAPDWLSTQLALRSDAVCGTIQVDDWGSHAPEVARLHAARYNDADGHSHVHGANLGVSARAYLGAGGFSPLASSEDVALVDALRHTGASIAWSAAPRVATSARRRYRAPGGFGATLEQMALAVAAASTACE